MNVTCSNRAPHSCIGSTEGEQMKMNYKERRVPSSMKELLKRLGQEDRLPTNEEGSVGVNLKNYTGVGSLVQQQHDWVLAGNASEAEIAERLARIEKTYRSANGLQYAKFRPLGKEHIDCGVLHFGKNRGS